MTRPPRRLVLPPQDERGFVIGEPASSHFLSARLIFGRGPAGWPGAQAITASAVINIPRTNIARAGIQKLF